MRPTNTNTFFGFYNPSNLLKNTNQPFQYLLFDYCPTSKMNYETFFQQSFVNDDIIPNNVGIKGNNTSKGSQQQQNLQEKSPSNTKISTSQKNQQTISYKFSPKPIRNHEQLKARKAKPLDEDYFPQDQSSFDRNGFRLRQAKNIPKIYLKGIILFISKNLAFTSKVLQHCGVNFSQFMNYFQGINKKTGSIAYLRSLWIDSQNPYAKVFRIISKEYLRKHRLAYIFNSRVRNVRKHLIYRNIIQECIGEPARFTHIKNY